MADEGLVVEGDSLLSIIVPHLEEVVLATSDITDTKTTAVAIFRILNILLSSIIVVKVLGSGKSYLRMGLDNTMPL